MGGPAAAGTMMGPAELPRDRRRPESDHWRPGHLLHDRARRREAPWMVANHRGRSTQIARVREGCGPPNEDLPATAEVRLVATPEKSTMPIPSSCYMSAIEANRVMIGRGDEAGGRTDRYHPCHHDRVLIASYPS